MADTFNVAAPQSSAIEVNKVLRNTYMLLAMTLLFSAVTAYASMALALPYPGFLITIVGFYGLLFLINKFQNSSMGILFMFMLTGFMGYTIGPILSLYLSIPNGGQLVANAFGLTAFTFLGLSGYALTSRKDFSFLAGFITAGFFVLLGAIVISLFFEISGLQLAISAGFVLFSSAAILFQTSAIIQGGERNYIMAAATLFVSIYNLFLSLLHLLSAFSGDD